MSALYMGPRPAGEVLARLDAVADTRLTSVETTVRAVLLAMNDRIEEARTLAATLAAQLGDFGGAALAQLHAFTAEIEAICGDDEAAAEHLRQTCADYAGHGLSETLSTYALLRGRFLCALGRYQEAEQLARQGRELGRDDDARTQSLWRQVVALTAAHRGDHPEAERLAREAVAITEQTDALWWQGDAYFDLAQTLEAARRPDEAAAPYQEALDRYERKQVIPLARRTRERLSALQESPA
jgi:tetratricopeptide (TPR) repeat protein